MPVIKAFKALKPRQSLLTKVVTRPLDDYSTGQAKLILSENEYNFLHLISPELDHLYLRGSRTELVYKKISENLEQFIDNGILVFEEKPAIYIYQIEHNGIRQTGIWTLTDIEEYFKGNIKKHENTVERREKALAEYIQQSNLDANPVLITYHKNLTISKLIDNYLLKSPDIDFSFDDLSAHRIWVVTDGKDLDTFIKTFSDIDQVYIADGHHRAASMAKMCRQKRMLNGESKTADYNYFSTVYMDTEEVKILPFYRLVRDLSELKEEEFIDQISRHFSIEKLENYNQPQQLHEMNMYLPSGWYRLEVKPEFIINDPVKLLDVSILQELILAPILKISDPRTDARLTFEGGRANIEHLTKQVDNDIQAVLFSLPPITAQQVIDVADAGLVMPPKSTFIEPKFLVGLLTNYFKH
ncbi:DUF1015 domain-containing protein [Pedobacter sp.]|uniref:DUF1015 domain-containing protein n=1 Tax=Pedobacter sp. TaxID=1411316 RepID=UPI00396C4417